MLPLCGGAAQTSGGDRANGTGAGCDAGAGGGGAGATMAVSGAVPSSAWSGAS